MRFSGICLITRDVLALTEFYKRALGLESSGDSTHMELMTEGGGIAIFTGEGMEEMAPGSMAGAGSGSITLGFEVADVDAEYERLQALDVDFVKLLQTHPWGSRSFWFRDPDGNIVNFWGRA